MIQAQAFFNEMLRQYPKLNTPAVIDALYTFTHELVRKSTTALNTVPSEDTETKALTFTDKNNSEIARISFTQYANANTGINFVLGEHIFTIKISDEGHIDLRSSYPLCGFSQVSDEVATTEYVIRCAEHYDAILENALKEYIAEAVSDLESELKQYSDDKDNALKAELKAYVDNKITALTEELAIWKNSIVDEINSLVNGIGTSSFAIQFGSLNKLFQTAKSEFTYTPSTNGFITLGWDRETAHLYMWINDVLQTGTHQYIGEYVNKGTGEIPITFPLKAGVKYKWMTCHRDSSPGTGGVNRLYYGFWTTIAVKVTAGS